MKKFMLWSIVVMSFGVGGWFILPQEDMLKQAVTWQRLTMPGELSRAHSFLDRDCAACHTPVQGIEDSTCISCHANNELLLQRQPTAFHASLGSCASCHLEHAGRQNLNRVMDHKTLATIGIKTLQRHENEDADDQKTVSGLLHWLKTNKIQGEISSSELLLQCSSCHSYEDPHQSFFGKECTDCHVTSQWTISAFRHPSPNSTNCAQCHQAPPSHYMEHFKMISATVAGKPHAAISECFECHQTTSWNEIQSVGWYKHH